MMLIDMPELVITSPYGERTLNFQKVFHQGVDLRSVNKTSGRLLDITAPERMRVIRRGVDGYGNYYLVTAPEESEYYELKFIHMDATCLSLPLALTVEKGFVLGKTRVGGNSMAHHLHFETWTAEGVHANPMEYFDKMGMKWKTA